MAGFWEAPNDYAPEVYSGHGNAGYVSGEKDERDVVERLRDVVEEVTRKPVERTRNRIGFI